MTTNENPAITTDTCGHPVCNPSHCNCHVETRAQDFINKADALGLSDADVNFVLDELLDVDIMAVAAHNELLSFGQTLFQSDDDYDDFRRDVCAILAGDDACAECGLDPDDCECDEDDDFEADPIDLQDEAEGRF